MAEKAHRLYFIEATTVEYIECDGNYVMIQHADGKVTMLIPGPGPQEKPTTTTEGVAADARGNVYGAEANSNNLRKYTR